MNHAPVFILGGFYDEKAILFSDSNFQDYVLLEVSDSRQIQAWLSGQCWVLDPEGGLGLQNGTSKICQCTATGLEEKFYC